MILNLETQELVNGGNGFFVAAGDAHPSSIGEILHAIFDLFAQALHRGHAGRALRVDQQRSIEVALLEHGCDMLQVLAYLIAAGSICRVIRDRFDASAIAEKMKMMRSLLMREAHYVIAAVEDFVVMRI